jgi:hypothetical protein
VSHVLRYVHKDVDAAIVEQATQYFTNEAFITKKIEESMDRKRHCTSGKRSEA